MQNINFFPGGVAVLLFDTSTMFVIETVEVLRELNLYRRIEEVFKNAFNKGELVFQHGEETEYYQENGLEYQFKIINALGSRPINRKNEDKDTNKKLNPFLKNEPDLTVCDSLLGQYKLLLNKFPNCENHFLMVTKEFVKQDTLLSELDLDTVHLILTNLNRESTPFFLFFNSGHDSGYSQIHKHIQFITLPVIGSRVYKPFIDDFVSKYTYNADLDPLTRPDISFHHFVLPIPENVDRVTISQIYIKLMNQLFNFIGSKIQLKNDSLVVNGELNPQISYNFILTSTYMMVIPRSRPNFNECWANSLQFMGLFSGKNLHIKQKILEMGFQNYLSKVGFPNESSIKL